MEEVKSKEDID